MKNGMASGSSTELSKRAEEAIQRSRELCADTRRLSKEVRNEDRHGSRDRSQTRNRSRLDPRGQGRSRALENSLHFP